MLIAVGGEALQIVLEEEEPVEGGVALLDGDVPGQHHDEEQGDTRPPDSAAEEGPLAAQTCEEKDDGWQKGATGPLARVAAAPKEFQFEKPELLACLVPGVPAEHSYAKRGGELHVRRGATGEADDGHAGDGDESGVEVTPGAEPPAVWRKTRTTRASVAEDEGRRAVQSETRTL